MRARLEKMIEEATENQSPNPSKGSDALPKDVESEDEREIRRQLRAWMRIEDEATLIKNKHDGANPSKSVPLYAPSKMSVKQVKQIPEHLRENEDALIAFDLLNAYKRDKGFI